MPIEEERRGQSVILRLRGTFQADQRADELDEALRRAEVEGRGAVVLDCTELKMLDSTALGHVAGRGRTLHAMGRELCLVQPNERIRLLLKLTSLDTIFPVAETVEQALGGT